MKDAPPPELVDLLARLGLARADQIRAVRGRVRRLARDLPGFESVWIDALAQARILTPFQAGELNAGRGRALVLGPYALHQPLHSPGYASVYRAFERKSRRWVRLSVIAVPPGAAAEVSARLKQLVQRSAALSSAAGLLPVFAHGVDGGKVWAASPDLRGQTAADWIIHHGRFPPAAVLEIAQQMLAALLVCEQGELVHGDLRPGQLLLDPHGKVWLPEPGLRLAVRPDEGFGHDDLPPEAYECLAPERVASGSAASTSTDLYACGCLWWHLLAGRPAIPGATSLAKLRAGQTTRIPEVRDLAPDVPPPLAEAIGECLRRDPQERPGSISRLALRLATPSSAGRKQLRQSIRRANYSLLRPSPIAAASRRSARQPTRLAFAAVAVATVVVGAWPYWGQGWKDAWGGPDRHAAVAGNEAMPARLPGVEARALASAAATGADSEIAPASWEGPPANVLELESSAPQRLFDLTLEPGMTVRGRDDRRAMLLTPPGGLNVDVEDVRFENIDFVADGSANAGHGGGPTLIRLRAFKAGFSQCSFQSSSSPRSPADRLPAAIVWLGRPTTDEAEFSLPTGELSFDRCAFRGVSSGVRCEAAAALIFEFDETLHLGPGPLVSLADAPRADEPMTLAMRHLTLRNAACLLECRYDAIADSLGSLLVRADDCAFVPDAGGGLVIFKGADHPGPLVERLEWTGQGSVLSREAPVALWHGAGGRIRAAAEEMIQVAGLVRTAVGFAGEAEEEPAASRIVRWQVPLRSTDPPGIGEEVLSLPRPPGEQ